MIINRSVTSLRAGLFGPIITLDLRTDDVEIDTDTPDPTPILDEDDPMEPDRA